MIYFDNAATTLRKPVEVIEAVMAAMQTMGNASRGVHEASLAADRTIYQTRKKLADFFHAESPKQIAFMSNATEGLNTAIRGILAPGDHVIATELEHNSVLRPLYEMQERGVEITFVKSDSKGRIDPDDFEREIKTNTKAIVCTHGSNLTGNLVDIKSIGALARRRGVLFVADVSQTAGIFPIDVQDMKIDILCFTGHKGLLGPQGTGGIYVRKEAAIRPLKSGGSGVQTYSRSHPVQMPTALEAGTLNGHGIAGLGAAVDYLTAKGLDAIRRKEQSLMWRFYQGVKEIPGVTIYGDFSSGDRCPIVALNIGDCDSARVSDELFLSYGIATRPGAHCAPLMHKALGTVQQGAVRFSFSHYNTMQEVETAISAISEIRRKMDACRCERAGMSPAGRKYKKGDLRNKRR